MACDAMLLIPLMLTEGRSNKIHNGIEYGQGIYHSQAAYGLLVFS